MNSDLKPLDLKQDAKFSAFSETKEIKFEHCKHKQAEVKNGELRCPCGASWGGARLIELQNALRGV
jgi:hypothetical protein